ILYRVRLSKFFGGKHCIICNTSDVRQNGTKSVCLYCYNKDHVVEKNHFSHFYCTITSYSYLLSAESASSC
ncbi:MAG: hypothetical protein ACOX7O_11485, partial [Oscillospiraceae bacterium]